MARFKTEVKATSNVYSPSRRASAASCASRIPRSDRSTSVQPVKRFSRFHVLWPCLTNTSLIITFVPFLAPASSQRTIAD